MLFNTWFDDPQLILSSKNETASLITGQTTITEFTDSSCAANKAIYNLIRAYCDHYYKKVISCHKEFGDKALQLLRSHCATVTSVDKNHFARILSSITMNPNEPITNYLTRFITARHNSEHVGNTHDDEYLIDIFLTGIRTKDPHYLAMKAPILTKIKNQESLTFAEVESAS